MLPSLRIPCSMCSAECSPHTACIASPKASTCCTFCTGWICHVCCICLGPMLNAATCQTSPAQCLWHSPIQTGPRPSVQSQSGLDATYNACPGPTLCCMVPTWCKQVHGCPMWYMGSVHRHVGQNPNVHKILLLNEHILPNFCGSCVT